MHKCFPLARLLKLQTILIPYCYMNTLKMFVELLFMYFPGIFIIICLIWFQQYFSHIITTSSASRVPGFLQRYFLVAGWVLLHLKHQWCKDHDRAETPKSLEYSSDSFLTEAPPSRALFTSTLMNMQNEILDMLNTIWDIESNPICFQFTWGTVWPLECWDSGWNHLL